MISFIPSPPETPILMELLADIHGAFLVFAFIVACLTLSVIIDLVLGIAKAKLGGRKIQSFKARKSAIKMVSYYGSLFMCFMCDLIFIVCHVFERPYLSMLIGACLVLIEIKSWFEKLSDKEQARIEQTARLVSEAVRQVRPNVDLGRVAEALCGDAQEAEAEAQGDAQGLGAKATEEEIKEAL